MIENIALFDMDGTLADYEGALRRDLKKLRSPTEPEITQVYGGDLPDWLEERIFMIRNQPKWWQKLEELPVGFEILSLCITVGFDIRILTKGPRRTHEAWTQKAKWCHCHVKPLAPDMQVTITEDKGLVYGKVLVDDYPPYMDRWLKFRPRGLGIMPAQPWNEGYSHPNVIRYTGGRNALYAALQTAYARQPRET
jgi:FMN phosphatase YigB (HAD superfamily)